MWGEGPLVRSIKSKKNKILGCLLQETWLVPGGKVWRGQEWKGAAAPAYASSGGRAHGRARRLRPRPARGGQA
jgi:hypothetical protein